MLTHSVHYSLGLVLFINARVFFNLEVQLFEEYTSSFSLIEFLLVCASGISPLLIYINFLYMYKTFIINYTVFDQCTSEAFLTHKLQRFR